MSGDDSHGLSEFTEFIDPRPVINETDMEDMSDVCSTQKGCMKSKYLDMTNPYYFEWHGFRGSGLDPQQFSLDDFRERFNELDPNRVIFKLFWVTDFDKRQHLCCCVGAVNKADNVKILHETMALYGLVPCDKLQ